MDKINLLDSKAKSNHIFVPPNNRATSIPHQSGPAWRYSLGGKINF
ncbi:hypothetical protein GGR28_000573 [Lewinella aquimaris]|uniref:Uncharacterized protein n=1 Tax=Neolewinella aquimaris TaxID=1835722 RepID=A0A840E2L1_9BACT|nr:hypothetical protein [Neolewinella aquimaris]